MTLQWTTGQINGAVSGSTPEPWSSKLFAEAAGADSTSGEYTLLLLPSTNAAAAIPPGDGYLLLTNHLGQLAFGGALADGSAVSQAPPLGRLGDVPVFVNLYSDTGLLLGWLAVTNGEIEPESPLVWIKPRASSGLFAGGFTNLLSVIAAGWANPPPRVSSVVLPSGTLVISNGAVDLTSAVSIVSNTIIPEAGSPLKSLAGTINPKTGLVTITFKMGSSTTTTTGYGAVLQDSTNAGGYFLTKTNAGSFLLTPN
jgi:hypothetical protein